MFELILNDKYSSFPITIYERDEVKIHIRGNIKYKGQYLDHSGIINKIININNDFHFEELLTHLDGSFNIVFECKDEIIVAVDPIRSIPLFYTKEDNLFIVYDTLSNIAVNNEDFSDRNLEIFYYSGFTLGNTTLLKSYYQIEAGHYLKFSKNKCDYIYKNYNHFTFSEVQDYGDNIYKRLDELHIEIFSDLVNRSKNKTILVPLSGGYDSRLIVYLLKRLGVENVKCFTYGKRDNKESLISKKIANKLNYEWFFVEYSKKEINENKSLIRDYMNFSSNYSSVPHLQDLLAINKLIKNKVINENCIVIPGHSYDFLAGSHGTFEVSFLNRNEIRNKVLDKLKNKHFNRWRNKSSIVDKELTNKFNESIIDSYEKKDINNFIDSFNFKERQSKYIINSVRVYDYFNIQWELPFWDKELIKFWSEISYEDKYDRFLFKKYMNLYFEKDLVIKTINEGETKYKEKLEILRKSSFLKRILPIFKRIYDYYFSPIELYQIFSFKFFVKFLPKEYQSYVSLLIVDYLKSKGIKKTK